MKILIILICISLILSRSHHKRRQDDSDKVSTKSSKHSDESDLINDDFNDPEFINQGMEEMKAHYNKIRRSNSLDSEDSVLDDDLNKPEVLERAEKEWKEEGRRLLKRSKSSDSVLSDDFNKPETLERGLDEMREEANKIQQKIKKGYKYVNGILTEPTKSNPKNKVTDNKAPKKLDPKDNKIKQNKPVNPAIKKETGYMAKYQKKKEYEKNNNY